jgi:hypothetical protein
MTLKVKPAAGLKVPDPFRKDHLPIEGREVEDNPYWRRLLKNKNIEVVSSLEPEPKVESEEPEDLPKKTTSSKKAKK